MKMVDEEVGSMKPTVFGVFAVLAFLFCGCHEQHSTFEITLSEQIERKCGVTACGIDLTKVTPFKWDTLYVFSESVTKADAEKETQQTLGSFPDLSKQFVFLQLGKVVHQESSSIDVERPRKDEVVFEDLTTPPGWLRIKANDSNQGWRSDEGVRHYILKSKVSS